MKFIHLSDLHIGKRVNEFSMLEDQKYIFKKILHIIDETAPDGVLIAGDIYDKSVPTAEAVQLLDDFLVRLSKRGLKIFAVSGNHDSSARIAFASRIMKASGIYLSPVYNGQIEPVHLEDEFGMVSIYLLPFIKPVHVRPFYPEAEIETYTDALRVAVEHMNINPAQRNILVAHQYVTGAKRCESEESSVGGLDNVGAGVFAPFDYTALGHIHTPQNIGSKSLRYCGTPLKYSFSEAGDEKSVTLLKLREKGSLKISTIPLIPKRDMREIKGSYEEITLKKNYEGVNRDDYMHITLTDEDDIPDVIGKLRVIYPNIMKLDYDNQRTRRHSEVSGAENVEQKSPVSLFAEFYEIQNNQEMSEEQRGFASELIEKIWEGER